MTRTFYHASPVLFEDFEQQFRGVGLSDVGFHFGNLDTALRVPEMLYRRGIVRAGDPVYVYEAELELGDAVELPEGRGGTWNVGSILRKIFEGNRGDALPWVPAEMADDYWEDVVRLESGENLLELEDDDQVVAIVEWLRGLGIDSIRYHNTFEGGGDSWIVFSPEQVRVRSVTTYEVPDYG